MGLRLARIENANLLSLMIHNHLSQMTIYLKPYYQLSLQNFYFRAENDFTASKHEICNNKLFVCLVFRISP